MTSATHSADTVIAATRHWLERAVIGLNLCPFAKSVYVKEQVRYAVSTVTEAPDVMDDLERELRLLADADPDQIDTTLLILPDAVADFLDFNDLLYFAERLLGSLGLEGTLQIASFHPQYQFAGTEPDDIENYTNRAPYPILHLLREDSIARAAAAFPDAADIYERNQATMRRLGHEGWQRWMAGEDEPGKG
ncbi:DUF1415 domain-containing protein [Cupriavidus necator]|uniref:DUF1415 domain-containing protein n=1 Tax=Cupriavidus necator (strain ATCC 17699 / DSM 428 / KCTC 22496 / NCIMB 10442 / H16 / Stanier 337) TaxID=381666 RepID=Q0KD04_CUPNH|nr:DUF1415 domain-containing protein [Cupriavidus necator]KUE89666.1 peptidase [Cupriavidus necator]QCC00031.1 DUF1415 domain-containing protein [Cupriavidus necator H16]QQB77156.1 DUF1415 domain-containing protein [Cupriavidus necator]WKA41881.1 DUF1415 domain-containing protein [Cupriavidus necator]CAJ92117.1 Uncharacterized protein conserved in bacteria [Cupriavidus necator H16]